MDCRLASLLCLLAVVPLTTGLQCYSCEGSRIGNENNDCVHAVLDKLQTVTCPSPPAGYAAKCRQEKNITQVGNIEEIKVVRSCAQLELNSTNDCESTEDKRKAIHIDVVDCYCSDEKCNGQATLRPVILTCFTILLLAVKAVL